MKKINQTGFTIVEVLLVLILIAILGFTGYYVYHAQHSADKTLDAANKSAATTSTATAKPKSTSSDTSAAAAMKYLDIKELGVKVPLSSTSDLSYTWTSNGYAQLTSSKLQSEVGQITDCSDYKSTPVEVGIVYADGAYSPDPSGKELASTVVAGKTYHFSNSGHAGANCPSTTASVTSDEQAYQSAVIIEFQSSVAAN